MKRIEKPAMGRGRIGARVMGVVCVALSVSGCGSQRAPSPVAPEGTLGHREPVHEEVSEATGLRFDERVERLIALLSIEEKVGQLNQRPGGHSISPNSLLTDEEMERVRRGEVGSYLHVTGAEATSALQRVAVEETAHGVPLLFGLDVVHGYRTIFPVPLAGAASWNVAGMEQAARMAAVEATWDGIHWTFAPMVDIARDPRWGRVVEGAGEDPVLGAIMAAAQVRGYQGTDLGAPDTLLACAKHYLGYGAAEGGRDYNSANLSSQEIFNVYMPPFLGAVKAGVGSLMTGFNDLSGVPMTAHQELIQWILRQGFDGFVVSDWNAVSELLNHGVAEHPADAAYQAFMAGVQMDMRSGLFSEHLPDMVRRGAVPLETLDRAVGRVLQAKVNLGLFDDPFRYGDAEKSATAALPAAHLGAARNLAAQSMVLLKNDAGVLPLSKELRRLAVIGPFADDPLTPLGSWKAMGDPENTVTFLQGIRDAVGEGTEVAVVKGCDGRSEDTKGIAAAVKAAKQADAVVLIVGEDGDMSGESRSRSDLDLPGAQRQLAEAVLATGKPVAVVLVGGRPLSLSWLTERAQAILMAWLPGTQAGPALADLLFGDASPGGKLPITFPRTAGQVPIYYAHRNTGRPADPDPKKHTSRYQDLPIDPLFAFGHGLSYTTFDYASLSVESLPLDGSPTVRVSADVTNTGKRDGVEVVQVYARDEVASTARPVQQLVGFARLPLAAGQTARVRIDIPEERFGFYTRKLRYEVEPGRFQVMVGSASDDIRLTGSLLIPE